MEAELKEVFALFDKDGGGTISPDEIGAVLKRFGHSYNTNQLNQIIKSIDKDQNGEIDFEEFKEMMEENKDATEADLDAELKYAFGVFDKDGDGNISAEEIMTVMQQLNEKIDKETVNLMVQSVDTDNNGSIDFDEFKTMMRDGPVKFK
mmetsp:Transcript_14933/g.21093  ORF Transcript_14933/g.21093 Transcript_14933/m.21093 type:complete len:149 (-) Transcript_14933:246-692(-)|eukprot:CAMPEP_0175100564 /NCGR_PEP_ID=MMETSP0086_2-20121207/7195_1 /TAXON_ID=136419 /ORGANISM="Unknown Unknown, Strain D1" /LENGTH=148 /DNA_ID=CAMNT_0016374765 /DNA_START=38 /DNA_END=484 /DNA_ORIENTATION=-